MVTIYIPGLTNCAKHVADRLILSEAWASTT